MPAAAATGLSTDNSGSGLAAVRARYKELIAREVDEKAATFETARTNDMLEKVAFLKALGAREWNLDLSREVATFKARAIR